MIQKSYSVRRLQGIITMTARGYSLGPQTVYSTKGSHIQQTHTTKALSHTLLKTYHFVSGSPVSYEVKSHSVGRRIQGVITMLARGYFLGSQAVFSTKGSHNQQAHMTKTLSHILVKTYHFVSGGSVSHEAKSHSIGRSIQGIITGSSTN